MRNHNSAAKRSSQSHVSNDAHIVIQQEGSGGHTELLAILDSEDSASKILYGAIKVLGIDDRGTVKSTREKIVAFIHIGSKVGVMRKGKTSTHKGDVMKYLNTASFCMEIVGSSGFSDKEIASKLIATGGAHKPNSYDFGGGVVKPVAFYES